MSPLSVYQLVCKLPFNESRSF